MDSNYIKMMKNLDKLPVYLDLDTLDIFTEYLLNDSSKYINYSNLLNLYDYVKNLDPETIKTNDSKMARYEFLKLYLEARLDLGIVSRKLCLNHVNDKCSKKYRDLIQREIVDSIERDSLGKKDIEFINNMIFTQLNIMFMQSYKVPLTKMIEDINVNEFGKSTSDCENAIHFLQMMLNDLSKAQRRAKQDNRINLSDEDHFKAIMSEAVDRLLSDNNYWQSGWEGLNRMLGGGFENSRIYNFVGATGGFKSGLLLNIMKSIKMHNVGRAHKDPTKRPTILFLSQENNIWETVSRIWGVFGSTDDIRKYEVNEIMSILAKGGFRICTGDEIDIEFRYYGNMDIGVGDIQGICEELDNSGREVICVIQDYIERLRPPVMKVEKRVQLFDISNQLHDLAVELDIPIITGSQLNRAGVATIEDMKNANKRDIGKNIGSKDISESYAMLKNFDVNISIVVEYLSEEERFYLSFRLLKFRGDDRNIIDYFLQPFVGKNSKIQLMEDINAAKPVYRTSLLDEALLAIEDEKDIIQDITRKPMRLTDLFNDEFDIDSDDIGNFIKTTQNEQAIADDEVLATDDSSLFDSHQQLMNYYRNCDSNGTLILKYKPKQKKKCKKKNDKFVITFLKNKDTVETDTTVSTSIFDKQYTNKVS